MNPDLAIQTTAVTLDPAWVVVIVMLSTVVGGIVTPLIGALVRRGEVREQARQIMGQQLTERETRLRDALWRDNELLREQLQQHGAALRACEQAHAETRREAEEMQRRIARLEAHQQERLSRESGASI